MLKTRRTGTPGTLKRSDTQKTSLIGKNSHPIGKGRKQQPGTTLLKKHHAKK
jgi:hypothetical protein